jgi:DNA polymerase-3 subunit alpha
MAMPHAPYVPLRNLSAYTLLEGAIAPKQLAARAKDLDFPAAALTDRNGLYAAMSFSEAAAKAGVQPIIGVTIAVARPGRPDNASIVLDWLVLLAQDETGYTNLCALVSQAHVERPETADAHVEFAALERFSDGLLCLTASGEGALARLIAEDQPEAASAYLDRLQTLFGDRLYIEL